VASLEARLYSRQITIEREELLSEKILLDQLWYTWSTAGLDAINAGYRVRAASEGLWDIQGIRYRRLSRFLAYNLSEEIQASNLDASVAPVSLAFITTPEERLLIRKVFTGKDLAGRNSKFFIHLIAGLPNSFTAREAIRLWDCAELWRTSEEGLPSNQTNLPKLPYDNLLAYAQIARPLPELAFVSDKLSPLLQQILASDLPTRINAFGISSLIAALIYGLTHSLPMTLLPHFTFNTYEYSEEERQEESQEFFIGTTTLKELTGDSALKVEPVRKSHQSERPNTPEELQYVTLVKDCLLSNQPEKQRKLARTLTDIERQNAGKRQLIELFQFRFHLTPLQPAQLSAILRSPHENCEDIQDTLNPDECATLLLNQPQYWKNEGQELFKWALNNLSAWPRSTQETLFTFIRAIVKSLLEKLESMLDTDNANLRQCCSLLETLVLPADYSQLWCHMLGITRLKREPLYTNILSGKLTWFHSWLLQRAIEIDPPPDVQYPQLLEPWLSLSWTALGSLLDSLATSGRTRPVEWLHLAMQKPLTKITKEGTKVILKHGPTFLYWLETQLQQQNIELARRFFQTLVTYHYEKRTDLLIFLLQRARGNKLLVDQLFENVAVSSDYPLSLPEFTQVLCICGQDILSTYGDAPTLDEYIQRFAFNLPPEQLTSEMTFQALNNLQTLRTVPNGLAKLLVCWWTVSVFLRNKKLHEKFDEAMEALNTIVVTIRNEKKLDLRPNVTNTLLPWFVEQIEWPEELSPVLETLVKYELITDKWDFLRRMAQEAGKRYCTREHFYRLQPYLIYGIREGERTNKSQTNINSYLDVLYENATQGDVLKHMDEANNSNNVHPLIQRYWNQWRKSDGANHRLVPNKQPLVVPSLGQTRPAEPLVPPANEVQYKVNHSNILAKVHTYNKIILQSEYNKRAPALVLAARFLLDRVFVKLYYSRLPTFERITLINMIKHVTDTPNRISLDILNYMIDDIIISAHVKVSRETKKAIKTYLENYPEWFQEQRLQRIDIPDLSQEDLERGFLTLVLRHEWIIDLNVRRKDPQAWLEEARQKAKVGFLI
jgi:hypothetical protein